MKTMRIVVSGLAATFPLGGMFWHYFQYVLGLRRLGHDVLYIEDTQRWCYHPVQRTYVADGKANAACLAGAAERLDPDLAGRWHFRDAEGNTFGRSHDEVVRFCREADMLLNLSASCWLRDHFLEPERKVLIDTDPLLTQLGFDGTEGEQYGRQYDALFTFGWHLDKPWFPITVRHRWRPTVQPVVLDRLAPSRVPLERRRQVLTTIASWDTMKTLAKIGDVSYGGKASEFERVIDLPSTAPVTMELALSGEKAPRQQLTDHGWQVIDAYTVSADPWDYLAYLADSLAEFSVAKHAYVASRCGWFSDRSACYLALGVPVIVQDTGFAETIGADSGLLVFRTRDEAQAAIEAVLSDPARHSDAAVQIAEAHFDSDRVLTKLLEEATADA